MKVINRTRDLVVVPIVLANGIKDSINLQPTGRAELPPGAEVDPQKLPAFRSRIQVVAPQSVQSGSQRVIGSSESVSSGDRIVNVDIK